MTGHKEVVVIHVAVHVSGDLSRFRSERRPASLQEDHDDNASDTRVRVRSEPAITRSFVRTSTGLAQDLFLVEVETETARRTILHRASHAIREFRNDGSDIELPFDARLEARDLFRSGWML